MSSPFQKNFSAKSPMSPLNGAYTEGRDRDIRTYRQSDRELFAKLQNDITGATLAAMEPKVSKCEALRNNWHADKMTDKAYADASKDCGETEGKDKNKLTKSDIDSTSDKKDPYNLTALMDKNPGLTDKQSIEQRILPGLSSRFSENVGNTY